MEDNKKLPKISLGKLKRSQSLEKLIEILEYQNISNRLVPLLSKEGLGEVLLDNPLQSPITQGGNEWLLILLY